MHTLLSTCDQSILTNFHISRINFIDNTNFDPIKLLVIKEFRKFGVEVSNEYLNTGIVSLKQYYAVALLDPLNMHAVSDKVDPFWHAHILFTKAYKTFCEEVVGSFMDHDPLEDQLNVEKVAGIRSLYNYTIQCFDKFFITYDNNFFPKTLTDAQLMCTHYNDIQAGYTVSDHALMPRNMHTQNQMVHLLHS
jgi:hypothetical protein